MRIRRKPPPAQRKGPTSAPAMNEGRWRSGIGHARFPQHGARLGQVVVEQRAEPCLHVALGVVLLEVLGEVAQFFGEARSGGEQLASPGLLRFVGCELWADALLPLDEGFAWFCWRQDAARWADEGDRLIAVVVPDAAALGVVPPGGVLGAAHESSSASRR